jgi:hypothetical protein
VPADALPQAPGTDVAGFAELPAAPRRRRLAGVVWFSTAATVLVGGIWFAGALGELAQWRGPGAASESASSSQVDPLPTVRASDVTLSRARSLFETGHAGDAVRLLGTIPLADVNRAEADRVLADIQRALLTSAVPASADTVSLVR